MVWTRHQWNVFKAARLQPHLELNREITLMEKDKANRNRDRKLEEAKLWWTLYDNKKELKKSLLKHFEKEDILNGTAELAIKSVSVKAEDVPLLSEGT